MYSLVSVIVMFLCLVAWGYIVGRQLLERAKAFIEDRDSTVVFTFLQQNKTYSKNEISIEAMFLLVMGPFIAFVLGVVWPVTLIVGGSVFMMFKLREQNRKSKEESNET